VFSSFVLLLLPPVALAIKEAELYLLAPYQNAMFWVSVVLSIVLFLGSFIAPGLLRRMKPLPNKSLHLSAAANPGTPEVKPVDAGLGR
jgi:hypothetical protein